MRSEGVWAASSVDTPVSYDEPDGIFADVRLSKGRVRMPVSTGSEQADLMERIEEKLSALEGKRK